MSERPIIRSHKKRVMDAKKIYIEHLTEVDLDPEKRLPFRHRMNMEAVVEGLLLDDIINVYNYRKEQKIAREYRTEDGNEMKLYSIRKYDNLIKILTMIAEIANALTVDHEFKAVWSNIPEHSLMTMVSGGKNDIDGLLEFSAEMLVKFGKESIDVAKKWAEHIERVKKIKEDDRNKVALYGIDDTDTSFVDENYAKTAFGTFTDLAKKSNKIIGEVLESDIGLDPELKEKWRSKFQL